MAFSAAVIAAFFRRRRVTKGGVEFGMPKFRGMCAGAEAKLAELNGKSGPVFRIADDPRTTRIGKVVCKLRFDKVSQCFNVLTADMSVVGPRLALPSEVRTYTDRQRQRLLADQGLSCYWRTRRNRDTFIFDEWVDLNLFYMWKCSLWTDFKLIVQTVGIVLAVQGS